jgi:hypothetical protein
VSPARPGPDDVRPNAGASAEWGGGGEGGEPVRRNALARASYRFKLGDRSGDLIAAGLTSCIKNSNLH